MAAHISISGAEPVLWYTDDCVIYCKTWDKHDSFSFWFVAVNTVDKLQFLSLGPIHADIAVPSVTRCHCRCRRCRCCRWHWCAGGWIATGRCRWRISSARDWRHVCAWGRRNLRRRNLHSSAGTSTTETGSATIRCAPTVRRCTATQRRRTVRRRSNCWRKSATFSWRAFTTTKSSATRTTGRTRWRKTGCRRLQYSTASAALFSQSSSSEEPSSSSFCFPLGDNN